MSENLKSIFDWLKEISEKISVILKLIFSISLVFSIIMGFTFAVTYMRINGFFSYEIFSLNSMWMFFMAFLYLFIIIFAFYGCLIAYIFWL